MWKKAFILTVLGIAPSIPLVAGGCASNSEQPNAVTGNVSNVPDSQNPRYQDQKHHFHPEWIDAAGH